MAKSCIGDSPSGFNPLALGDYGELYILESDAYSGLAVATPMVIAPMNRGPQKNITLSGANGRMFIEQPGSYQMKLRMSFSLSGAATFMVGFFLGGVLVPDTEQSVDIQNANQVENIFIFGQFEAEAEDLPLIFDVRPWATSARIMDVQHLTWGTKGLF
ncbi:MAG: hypothetical protein KAR42_15040 [candidate division Zixibacteria bacterium]|nr:hypothetical protein [candidate division Zixibacteria bacterium]